MVTAVEAQRLVELEGVIERGLQTFVEVGRAVLEIRDGRLYRGTYGTFEEYCRGRWSRGRRWAYQLMDAAEVVSNLCAMAHTEDDMATIKNTALVLPNTERVARELVGLEPGEQRACVGRGRCREP